MLTISSLHPDPTAFTQEVEEFLSARLPRRRDAGPPAPGDVIEVHGLERRPGPEVAAAVAAASRWQAQRFDAGLGWLTGPRRYGGRALPPLFERLYRVPSYAQAAPGQAEAFETLARALGGDTTGVLYRVLVVQKKLATDARASYDGYSRDAGEFSLTASR